MPRSAGLPRRSRRRCARARRTSSTRSAACRPTTLQAIRTSAQDAERSLTATSTDVTAAIKQNAGEIERSLGNLATATSEALKASADEATRKIAATSTDVTGAIKRGTGEAERSLTHGRDRRHHRAEAECRRSRARAARRQRRSRARLHRQGRGTDRHHQPARQRPEARAGREDRRLPQHLRRAGPEVLDRDRAHHARRGAVDRPEGHDLRQDDAAEQRARSPPRSTMRAPRPPPRSRAPSAISTPPRAARSSARRRPRRPP